MIWLTWKSRPRPTRPDPVAHEKARRLICALLLVAGLLAGCGGWGTKEGTRDEKLETVEVGEGVSAGLTTAFDQQAKALGPEVAGVLPEGFPADLPLYTPSSLVDFGEADAGRRYVEFDAADAASVVRRRLEADLARSGWRPLSAGSATSFVQGDRQVVVTIRDLSPGSRIRYVYRPER